MKRMGAILLFSVLLCGCATGAQTVPETEYTETFDVPATEAPLTADGVTAAYTEIVRELRNRMGVYADGGTNGIVCGRLTDMNADGVNEMIVGYLRSGQARVKLYALSETENAVMELLDTRVGYATPPDVPDTTLYFCARYLILSETDAAGEHLYFYQVRDGELVTLEYQTYFPTDDTEDVGYTLDGLNIDSATYRSFVDLYWGAGKTDALSLPSAVLTRADGQQETVSVTDFFTALGL